ncbi:hypothetical protein Trisim1_000567 [Trichoderma cf. simile WF8]
MTVQFDSRYLISGSNDSTIKIWDIIAGEEQQTLQGHNGPVWSVQFSADGRCIASGSSDKAIKIWDRLTGKEQQSIEGHNGRYLASGSDDNTIKIWDVTGKDQQILQGDTSWALSATLSPDGRYFASGSSDNTVKIWDITGKEQYTLKGHKDSVWSVAFSPDGRYLASGSSDNTVKIWDITGEELQTLECHNNWVRSVSFSADGRYLASGSNDKTIKIWDTLGKKQQTLSGHDSWVELVTFSADGRYLISKSDDKIIKIWDTTTGKERQTLKVNDNAKVYAISSDELAVYLHTNIGSIKLDMHPVQGQDQNQQIVNINNAQNANTFDYGLSIDKCWITWNGHNILWLPPQYQLSEMAKWPGIPHSMTPQRSSTDFWKSGHNEDVRFRTTSFSVTLYEMAKRTF